MTIPKTRNIRNMKGGSRNHCMCVCVCLCVSVYACVFACVLVCVCYSECMCARAWVRGCMGAWVRECAVLCVKILGAISVTANHVAFRARTHVSWSVCVCVCRSVGVLGASDDHLLQVVKQFQELHGLDDAQQLEEA
jgi:hypothetical protein